MINLFTRYREVESKNGSLINIEWRIPRGGYLNMGKNNWTFCHRFATKGQALFGTEKQFILRVQLALDFEPRFSWFTLELLDLFEARWIYFWLKLWPGRNLKFVFNFGWQLSLESRRFLQNQAREHEVRGRQEFRRKAQAVQRNGVNSVKEVI